MIKKYDIDYYMTVETPHTKWAKPYSGGKMKALFIPNIPFGREVIEMAQRFDIDYETVTIDRNWDTNKWGLGEHYDLRAAIWDFDIVFGNLENAVCDDADYDVLIIPGINGWGFFPEKAKQAILKRVEAGAGLIINRPCNGIDLPVDEVLAKLSPLHAEFEEGFTPDGYAKLRYDLLENDAWQPADHYITKGIPFEAFDCNRLGIYPYKLADDAQAIITSEKGLPVAAVKTYGKGRIVAFGYIPTMMLPDIYDKDLPVENGCFGSLTLASSYPEKNVRYNENEYIYAMLGRAMLWAAKKEAKTAIDKVTVDGRAVAIASNAQNFSYTVHNMYQQLIAEGKLTGKTFELPECVCAGGEYHIKVSALDGDAVADFYTVFVSYPKVASIASVAVNCGEALNPGEVFSAKAVYQGSGAKLSVGVYDDFDNLLIEKTLDIAAGGELGIDYTVVPQRALNLRMVAAIMVGEVIIDRVESARVVAVPTMRTINDFEALMSPMYRGRPDYLLFMGEIMRNMGITGLYPGDNRMVLPSGAEGLGVYWYKRANYVARKEKYLATKDKQYLCRQPCLSDPAFWHENYENIEKTMAKGLKFGALSYFANDEGSLTCYTDEFDFCFCEHCMRDMRAWLKERYASLDALNATWQTAFATWDDVVPDTFLEAGKRNCFAAWGDHRMFMEKVFTGAYEKIIAKVRELDPAARIRMSGCQTSSPYTGCDYYLLHRHVGYFEAYTGGNQSEFHRSFAKPDTIIGGWTGYGVKGINARLQIWERVLHGFTLHSVFFNFSNINPDYTYPQTAIDLSRVFIELRREGLGKLLLHTTKRDDLGIAIHYSMASIHGSYVINAEQKFSKNRDGWVSLLESCGYQYNFVATQQLEAGELSKYRLLILPFSIALSKKETEEIRKFVANGGFVLADFQTGVMDEHCAQYDQGSLDDLFGIVRHDTLLRPFFTDQEVYRNKKFGIFDVAKELSGFEFAEASTRALNMEKVAFVHDMTGAVPAVVVNDTLPAGKAVYLNVMMDVYPEMNKKGEGAEMRALLHALLDYAGIEKFATLTDKEGNPLEAGLETVYYSDGEARYVALLRQYYSNRAMGHDGLAVGGTGEQHGDIMPVIFNLPRKAHIYDMREKKYLGFTDTIESTIEEGNVRLLSVLPEQPAKLAVSLPATIAQGDEFTLGIATKCAGYTRVAAINFTSPSGKYGFLYSQNAQINGDSAELKFRFPLNEELGTWTVSVKDVATGETTVSTFICQ